MMNQLEQKHTHTQEGVCPTCGSYTTFVFLGEQRWPPRVAEKLGLAPIMLLWTCGHCQTTISEPASEVE